MKSNSFGATLAIVAIASAFAFAAISPPAALADVTPPPAPTTADTATPAAPAAPEATSPAEPAAAETAAPTAEPPAPATVFPAHAVALALNSGDTAWMLTSTALVLLMTIPGLALFYSGMVRKKNILATAAQSFAITAL
ncbi:MAG: ammonia channel protein, partial [Alphaproteobacteria bacterium]|nr:ammonia channel protein [Alphaproteobacteria bacterium]